MFIYIYNWVAWINTEWTEVPQTLTHQGGILSMAVKIENPCSSHWATAIHTSPNLDYPGSVMWQHLLAPQIRLVDLCSADLATGAVLSQAKFETTN